ncbi:MAG: STAS/SEC14 domain-containing protein [Catalinimonas sp.]
MHNLLCNSVGEVYFEGYYDEAGGWFYNNWIGRVASDEVRAAAMHGLTSFERHGHSKLLNDNRRLEGSWGDANDWLAHVWMPRALAAGLKQFAHVVSPDVFAALSAEDFLTLVPEIGFEMRIFESIEAAEAWLRE